MSPLKKKDSFSRRFKLESFFLLIKPTKNIYKNTIKKDLLDLEIELLIKSGFISKKKILLAANQKKNLL